MTLFGNRAMKRIQPCCIFSGAIVSITLMLAAPALATESQFVYVPRANSPGADYSRADNSSFDDCVRRCDQQSACNAFTYNQRHAVCFLKRSANVSTTFYAFAITGIKLSPYLGSTNRNANGSFGSANSGSSFLLFSQTDSPGNDYSRIDGSSYEACRNGCAADNECNAFTYNHAHSVCFLKRAPNPRPTFYAWAITGIKQRMTQPVPSIRPGAAPQASPPPAPTPAEPQVAQAPTTPSAASPEAQIEQAQPQGAGEVVIADFSGKGLNTTRPFTVDGPWEVQWSSDDFIQIFLEKAEGGSGDILANQIEAGSGSSYQPQGGSYYLQISGMGTWHVKVVAIKNPGTGASDGGGHTLEENMPPVEQAQAPQPAGAPDQPRSLRLRSKCRPRNRRHATHSTSRPPSRPPVKQ